MRETKFRVMMFEPTQGHDDIWVYVCEIGSAQWRSRNGCYYGEIKYETLGQYTGLKDKKGVEIYGGDVVKHLITSTPRDCYGVKQVIYSEGMFKMLREDKGASPLGWPSPLCLEVIGNIYENPELLEGENL